MPAKSNAARTAAKPDLMLARTFDAPRELVFQLWTQPRHIAQWWGPMGYTAPVCDWDFRPGGAMRFCMRSPEGQEFWLNGMVREVVPPERLVFSSAAEDDAGQPILEDLNTVTFTEAGGKTYVTLHIRVLRLTPAGQAYLDGMEHGWAEGLALLENAVAQASPTPSVYVLTAQPAQRSFTVTRLFNAPRALVFEAMTQCRHMTHWYGPRGFSLGACHIDLRRGGAFRWDLRDPQGGLHAFQGTYWNVNAPERLVYTERFAAYPDAEQTVTAVFTEEGGKTRLTTTVLHKTVEDRDGHLNAGRQGMQETLDRLDEYLGRLA